MAEAKDYDKTSSYYETMKRHTMGRKIVEDPKPKPKPEMAQVRSTAPALPANPKQAYGDAKPQLALCPHSAMIEQAKAHKFGANKYGPYNWRKTKVESMTYAHAIMRHVQEWIDGKDKDEESGAHPFGHIMASCAIVIDAQHEGMLIDNRPKKNVPPTIVFME